LRRLLRHLSFCICDVRLIPHLKPWVDWVHRSCSRCRAAAAAVVVGAAAERGVH
jgi:hypothetical protein